MSTITRERAAQIAEGGGFNFDEIAELARIALASLEAEPAIHRWRRVTVEPYGPCPWHYGNFIGFSKPVEGIEDEYFYSAPPAPVSVPDGYRLQPISEYDAMCAAMLQGADGKPELTVWYGAMPESNGKANWTAILHRKGEGRCMNGFTIDRSEYPGRVLYAADRVRYLIGEKSERPSILDYDADAHSGYMKTGNSPVIPDGWVACSERMPDDDDFVYIWPRPDFGVELHVGQYCECHPKGDGWYAQVYEQNYGIEWCPITVTHWMPLPAAPQQEVTQALAKGMERYGDAMQKLADSGD